MSRLMQRLAQDLGQERDEYKRAEIVAQLAAYSARTGKFDEARTQISSVRATFSDGRSGRVTALVMIAEGLLAHYEALSNQAKDRLMRAQLLGDVMRDQQIIALASAWRAHVEYESSSFDVAAHCLKKAISSAADEDHAARSRCCIVLYNALAFVGDQASAQHYFVQGRQHAVDIGDQASIEALQHNKATYGVARLWVQRCLTGESDVRLVSSVRAEVNSSKNLQQLVRISAHGDYIDLSECNLYVLEERYSEALDLLAKVKAGGPYPAQHFNDDFAQLLTSFCLAQIGRADEAVAAFNIDKSSWGALDVDDRLIVTWLTNRLASSDERFYPKQLAAAAFAQALEEYTLEVERVKRLFADIKL